MNECSDGTAAKMLEKGLEEMQGQGGVPYLEDLLQKVPGWMNLRQ
jgi:hypothetical protein